MFIVYQIIYYKKKKKTDIIKSTSNLLRLFPEDLDKDIFVDEIQRVKNVNV